MNDMLIQIFEKGNEITIIGTFNETFKLTLRRNLFQKKVQVI